LYATAVVAKSISGRLMNQHIATQYAKNKRQNTVEHTKACQNTVEHTRALALNWAIPRKIVGVNNSDPPE